MDAQRVLIYGVTGSGKTTFARRLSEASGLPWHSVDDLTWEPGWVMVSEEIQKDRISEICSGDRWILDTAYGKWIDIPVVGTELILALDYPRWFSLQRLFRRTVMRLFDGKLICNGNRETLKSFFSRESILVWHFKSFDRKRERIEKWDREGRRIIRFKSAKETERWLAEITQS